MQNRFIQWADELLFRNEAEEILKNGVEFACERLGIWLGRLRIWFDRL